MSIKEDILATEDRNFEEMPVPEWKTTLRIYEMNGTERDAYEATLYEVKGEKVDVKRDNMRAKLLVHCLYDTDDNRLFSDADVQALGKKSAKVLDRLYQAAQRINAMTRENQDLLEKN